MECVGDTCLWLRHLIEHGWGYMPPSFHFDQTLTKSVLAIESTEHVWLQSLIHLSAERSVRVLCLQSHVITPRAYVLAGLSDCFCLCVCLCVCLSVTKQRCRDIWIFFFLKSLHCAEFDILWIGMYFMRGYFYQICVMFKFFLNSQVSHDNQMHHCCTFILQLYNCRCVCLENRQ